MVKNHVISNRNKKYIYKYYMDWTLIFIIVLFAILIYMNFKKIIKSNKEKRNKNKNKKVSWSLSNAAAEISHHNPSIDFFNETSNTNGIIIEGNNIDSNIIKYLNKQNESYGSKLSCVNSTKAWIPEDPDLLDNKNSFTAHQIINENDSNTRIQNYRDFQVNEVEDNQINQSEFMASTVGEVYDNMVDNFRVKWGKINGLGTYESKDYYGLDVEPTTNGYTGFATY